MITIRYEVEGLNEAIAALEHAVTDVPSLLEAELETWARVFVQEAQAYPFPKRETMRGIDERLRGVPRFRDFWRYETEQLADGAALDVWNEHEAARYILFPTMAHPIPSGGAAQQRDRGYPLRWYDYGGGEHRAWGVHHPGTPGQPVHRETLQQLDIWFEGRLAMLADDWVRMIETW